MKKSRNIDTLLKNPSGVYHAGPNPIPLAPRGTVSLQPLDDSCSIEIEINAIDGDRVCGQVVPGSEYYSDNGSGQIDSEEIVEFSRTRICGVLK